MTVRTVKTTHRQRFLAAAIASAAAASYTSGAALTWDGDTDYANGASNVSGNWNGANLWRAGSPTNANVTWSSVPADTATFGGSSAYTVTVNAPTTAGSVTINNGNLTLDHVTGNVLTLNGSLSRGSSAAGTTTISAALKFAGATMFSLDGASGSTINVSGPIEIANTANDAKLIDVKKDGLTINISSNISGTVGGNGRLTISPSGSSRAVTYSGDNSYTASNGPRLTSAGTVYLAHQNALGAASNIVSFNNSGGEESTAYGGTDVRRLLTTQASDIAQGLAGLGNVSSQVIGGDHASGTTTFNGFVSFNRAATSAGTFSTTTLAALQAGATTKFNGTIIESMNGISGVTEFTYRNVEVLGPGTVVFDKSNSYRGNTTIKSGTLQADGLIAAAAALNITQVSGSAVLTVNSGDMSGIKVGQPINTANGIAVGLYVVAVNGNQITMSGTATNGRTQNITLPASSATGVGNVIVDPSATLAGTGGIAGSITVNGTLAPGNSVGTLTLGSGGSLAGTTLLEIAATGTAADKLNITGGSLTLGGNLSFVPLSRTFVQGEVFDFLDGAFTGTFANAGNAAGVQSLLTAAYNPGANLAWDATTFYSDGTAAIVVVPEPAALSLLALATLPLMRRRRV